MLHIFCGKNEAPLLLKKNRKTVPNQGNNNIENAQSNLIKFIYRGIFKILNSKIIGVILKKNVQQSHGGCTSSNPLSQLPPQMCANAHTYF